MKVYHKYLRDSEVGEGVAYLQKERDVELARGVFERIHRRPNHATAATITLEEPIHSG